MSLPPPRAALDVGAPDGATIRVRLHGKAGGNRLFVSHGNGFAADGYALFWQAFLADFEVAVFDLRHHGQNPPPDAAAAHDYAHIAGDLALVCGAVAAEFGARPSAGLFHSMSAQAAMLAALETGWRLDALVAFDPPNVPPAGAERAAMLAYLRRLVGWASGRRERFADLAELASEYAATGAGRSWAAGAHRAMAEAVLRRDLEGGWRLRCPPVLEAAMYEQGITLGLWPARDRFAGPVKLIGADPRRERPSPTALANRALARAGDFDYAAIPGTGHLLQLEAPEACAAAARAFLVACGLAR